MSHPAAGQHWSNAIGPSATFAGNYLWLTIHCLFLHTSFTLCGLVGLPAQLPPEDSTSHLNPMLLNILGDNIINLGGTMNF